MARWSVPGQPASTPALIAWLPASSSRVKVGPPLSPRGSRLATALLNAKPQVAPVSRLPPLLVTASAPAQLVAAVFAMIVFFTAALSSLWMPEPAGEVLLAIVTLVSEIVAVPRPEFLMPPPFVLALLPLMVTLVRVALEA